MYKTRLCFGIIVSHRLLAESLGIDVKPKQSQKCTFCGDMPNVLGGSANFCPNCGHDLRVHRNDMSAGDLVEAILFQIPPPKPITIMETKDEADSCVCVCQILAEGVGTAEFTKPVAHYGWKPIERAIIDYAMDLGVEGYSPRLFAMAEQEK